MRPARLFTLTSALALCTQMVACANPADPFDPLVAPVVEPGSPEEAGVLAFLNDASTTFVLLDEDVALDRRAAQNLVDRRDGADGVTGTGDDMPFMSIDEVDAVPYVGPVALEQILEWTRANGWIPTAVDRDVATLALVNDPATDVALLDDTVRLDARAARNIIAARPFATVAELDAVPYVGPTALDRLAEYALANGYGGEPPPPADAGCAIISEYVEGSGNNNKAVEITNCGDAPIDLSRVGICLVRNTDTTCSRTAMVGTGELAAGEAWTTCRTQAGTFNDPLASLAAACDAEIGGVATFNGDDRLVLFADTDGDGAWTAADVVLDTFGDPAAPPAGTPWAEVTYRRCDLTPHAPGPFVVEDYFHTALASDHTDLGVPPVETCGSTLAAEGEECVDTAHCEAGLTCVGVPFDGSSPFGQCIDPTPIPGEGAICDRVTPCADGLICAGWTLFAEGTCVPQWMAGRFHFSPSTPLDIHDPPSGGIQPWVIVQGLASVPVDLDVTLHIEHPRPSDLRVTLIDPNGDTAVLWDRSPELSTWSRSFVTTGISRDDNVNGRWSLRIEDLVSGEQGTFHSWTLFATSRWD